MKKFIYALAMAALFTGCIKEEAHEIDTIDDNQIRFSTGMDVETRAPITGTAFASNEHIGIFATQYTPPATSTWYSAVASYYMPNVEGTTNALNSNIALSSYFWPETNSLNFYAYHPYMANSVFVCTTSAAPLLDITTVSHSTDYLWATPVLSQTKATNASSPVALRFNHAFSLIRVKVRLDTTMPFTSTTLTNLTLITDASTSNQKGRLNIATGDFSHNGYDVVTYTSAPGKTITNAATPYTEVDQIIFAPTTKIAELTVKLANNVEYTKKGLNIVAPAGKVTDILVTISPTNLSFTASVTEWSPGTDQTITAQ